MQSTTVSDICIENRNVCYGIHTTGSPHEIADNIGNSMDLDDVQMDDKMDIVSNFEEN